MDEVRFYIDLAAKAYRDGAFNMDTLKTIGLSDFGDSLGSYAWIVIKPVAIHLLLSEVFAHYITPFVLLCWDIWANDAQYPLRTLHWLNLWAPITINKIVLYPSVSIAVIPLLIAAFTLSYLRIIQSNRVHPLELWFWRTCGDEFDWRLQYRLAQVLEERQIQRREEKYRDIPETPLLTDEEFIEVVTVVDGIRTRKEAALQAQLDSYREYNQENNTFPTMAVLDRYYRAGWDTSIYMLQEFDSNHRFCRPVRWHTDTRTGVIDCFNGYKTRHSGDLMANHEDLVVGSISIMRPADIRPALKLIKGVFNHLRFFSTTYMRSGLHAQRRKWREGIAIHVEYLRFLPEFERGTVRKLDVDVVERDERETQSTGDGKESVYVQKDRELINILTITVDRYCVAIFHVAHMLRTPNSESLEELRRLFRFLMNPLRTKIWLDLPRGIAALDATMEHCYRGRRAPDEPYPKRRSFREFPGSLMRYPSFKDVGPADHFYVNRPDELDFPRGSRDCPLGFHANIVDYANRSCPCFSGNFGFRDLLDTILRSYHFIPYPEHMGRGRDEEGQPTGFTIPDCWAEQRVSFDYEEFVSWMLAGDRYLPLLHHLRTGGVGKPIMPVLRNLSEEEANRAREAYEVQLEVYQNEQRNFARTLRNSAGFEQDDRALGYAIGTGVGIALAYRLLLTCEIPRVAAERLSHYGYMENIEVHPWATETALFRPLPEIGVLSSEGNVLGTYQLELAFDRAFDRRDPEPASTVVDGLIVDSERYKFFPTHDLLPATLEREIRLSFAEMGMEYPDWVRPPPSAGENEQPGIEDLRESLGPRTIRNRLRSNGNFQQEISVTNYAVSSLIKHSFNQSDDLGLADEAVENPRQNVLVYARFLLLIQAHFDGTDTTLKQGIDGLVAGILGGSWYLSLPPEEQERMQNLRNWYTADREAARNATRRLQEDVCAETLVVMLMHEISKFEALDGRRRTALNLEVMRENYTAYTNESIYQTPEARSVMDRLQLGGVFQYEEPFWYKRLQVRIGPLLAEGEILATLGVERQCGFRDMDEIIYHLVGEVEKFTKLNELQIELSRLLVNVCEDAGIPIDYTGPRRNMAKHIVPDTLNAILRSLHTASEVISRGISRAILFVGNFIRRPPSWTPSPLPPAEPDRIVDDFPDVVEPPPATTWQLPTWCTYLLNDLTLYDQTHLPPPPSNPRRVDELNALISLLISDPPITPNDQIQYTKWWSRRVRYQAVRMADEHIELFRLPDLDLINPTLEGTYHYPGDEFGMDLDALDLIRRENVRARGAALQRALDEGNANDGGGDGERGRRRRASDLAWRGWSLDVRDYFRSAPARRWRDEL